MTRNRRFRLAGGLSFSLFLALLAAPALAQSNKPVVDAAGKKTTPGKRAPNNEAAERAARERHAAALSLLVTLADDARSFNNENLRARIQARVADALWDADPDRARLLFHKAWDAAELADQESAHRTAEERQRQQAAKGAVALTLPPDLRSEVLRLAAKRDRALGEELLGKLTEARKQEANDAAAPASQRDPFEAPAATQQRLRLANQLLESDMERALQFADPALQTVTLEGLNFLSSLRDKNPAAADQRYTRMLSIAGADLQADANTVSLLASYPFSPHVFVTFLRNGGQQTSSWGQGELPSISSELRDYYLRLAAQILLRPLPPPEQDQSSSGIQGKYHVIKRLLPLFEQYAPKETVEQLRVELAALGQGSDQDVPQDEVDSLRQGITPDRKAEDREQSFLDRIERARTAAERDGLYVQLALLTANKGDLRARDFADKIDDSELRKQVKPYVDVTLAMSVVEKKDAEKALTVARKGELSHIQRVWVLTQAAKLLPPADREKALEIIGEALEEARRIEASDADRPRALVAVANAFAATDRERAWETMLDAAKAANSGEGFTGEEGRLLIRLQTPNQTSLHTSTVDDFNLLGIFRTLTGENYTQAIQLARNFEGEAPRSNALISIARTILGEKQK